MIVIGHFWKVTLSQSPIVHFLGHSHMLPERIFDLVFFMFAEMKTKGIMRQLYSLVLF